MYLCKPCTTTDPLRFAYSFQSAHHLISSAPQHGPNSFTHVPQSLPPHARSASQRLTWQVLFAAVSKCIVYRYLYPSENCVCAGLCGLQGFERTAGRSGRRSAVRVRWQGEFHISKGVRGVRLLMPPRSTASDPSKPSRDYKESFRTEFRW